MKDVKIVSVPEGTVVYPKIPVIRVEGPLGACQLLETTLLNLVNYATLITTNAVRFRKAAGDDKVLLEFGLRRAQGPDGGMSASRYSYIGGFDATSNLEAGMRYHIPVRGTHAHSFVLSYSSLDDLPDKMFEGVDMVKEALKTRQENGWNETNLVYINIYQGELAAFIAYAQSFPKGFLCLVDSYDSLRSGIPNFLCVAKILYEKGYKPLGIRLDSGDLAYLSKETRKMFITFSKKYNVPFEKLGITGGNDINEDVLYSLNTQKHEITAYGIGTNLVTCQAQPALGMVYKLVEINEKPRMKLTQDIVKMSLPGKKCIYRLFDKEGIAILDLMTFESENPPKPDEKILCRHPFEARKRVYVTPAKVEKIGILLWDGSNGGLQQEFPTIEQVKQRVIDQLKTVREDITRKLNPTPYKVSLSSDLYDFMQNLWLSEVPIPDL